MHTLTVYTIFWLAPGYHFEAPYGGPGSTVADFRYEDLIQRFFRDVGSTPYYNILTQYSDQTGQVQDNVTFGGSFVDIGKLNQFNPSDLGTASQPLMDSDIQDVIKQAAKDSSWPVGSPNVEYFVFTPATAQSCYSFSSCDGEISSGPGAYCAYHSSFASSAGTTLYANMFDAGYSTACGGPNWQYMGKPVGPIDGYGPNGDAVADYEISPTSHEMAETVTDPSGSNGWYDLKNMNEIGDTCAYNFGTLNPDKGDVVLQSHSYLIQREWSNDGKACVSGFSWPATLPVNSTADSVPAHGLAPLCPSVPGGDANNLHYSLRCAIGNANNDAVAETTDHVITFNTCGSSCVIKLTSALPPLKARGLAIAGGGTTTLSGRHAVRGGLYVDASYTSIGGLTVENFIRDAIDVGLNSRSVRIGGSLGNVLKNNGGFGLSVGSSGADGSKAIFTSNRIYGDAAGGIRLTGLPPAQCGSGLKPGAPNDYLPCPLIAKASRTNVSGTSSCDHHCTVQLFLVPKRPDRSSHGQAQAYIGQATVSGETWSVKPVVALAKGQRVTATVTDPDVGETSEFSANKAVR
jgi:hypothetical protein